MSQDLSKCSKEELIEKIHALERQLANLTQGKPSKMSPVKSKKPFDFSQYKTRHIMLKFLYLGWNYQGFVIQEDLPDTVEIALFNALIKTRLIESRETCNYHRCGRTDKGVSAFRQVISLTVRSKMRRSPTSVEMDQDGDLPAEQEFDYVAILNSLLPKDIRMLAWAPVAESKSARFDCIRRTYRYFFPRMTLNIGKMNEACQFLLGEHDFRNLCKMDVSNGVLNYVRRVYNALVRPFSEDFPDPHYSICVFEIEASAFLWHQIRFIMTVLFLVGQELEPPSIMEKLLDIENFSSRPQFRMASDLPLVLYDVHYDINTVPQWIYRTNSIDSTITELHTQWTEKATQCSIIRSMMDSMHEMLDQDQHPSLDRFWKVKHWLVGETPSGYRPLLERPTCHSLEEKIKRARKNSSQK